MRVVQEDVIFDLLRRCLHLGLDALPHLKESGTLPLAPELVDRYRGILGDLVRQKRHDSVLSDESWEWIWDVPEDLSHLQLFGRLAWLHYNIFNLL